MISSAGTADSRAEPPLERYSLYAAIVLMIVYMMNFLDRQLLAVLAEAIKVDLDISDSQLGFLFGTAFAIFYAVFGMPLARLADLASRKRLIAGSVGFWSVMTALSGFAGGFASLAACRFGVGFGEAGASPASYSMLCDYFPRRLRATAISLYSVGVYVGSGIGLFLGGAIMTWWGHAFAAGDAPLGLKGWQAAFLLVGAPGILLAFWVLTLREPVRGRYDDVPVAVHPAPVKEFGAVMASMLPIANLWLFARGADSARWIRRNLVVGALVVLLFGLLIVLTGDIAQWIAVGLGVYATLSWMQGIAARDGETFRLIFRNRALLLAIGSIATVMFANYSFTFWTIPLFQRLFGASAGETGLFMGLANAIGGSLGVVAGGMLADAIGRRRAGGKSYVMIASALLSGVSALAMLFSPDKTIFFCTTVVFLFMVAMGVAPALSFVTDLVPAGARATASALTLLGTNFVGFAIGPYVIGKVSDIFIGAGDTPAIALRTAMLLALLCVPLAALLAWRAGVHVHRDPGTRA